MGHHTVSSADAHFILGSVRHVDASLIAGLQQQRQYNKFQLIMSSAYEVLA